ncbi:hypothetical protein JCM6882_005008 [Rhodosporidiobolus microsporus]
MRITISDREEGRPSAWTRTHVPIPSGSWFRGAESMVAGAGAGLVTSVMTCPLDVIKTKLQAGGAAAAQGGPNGLVGTFNHIWQHDGFRGLYRGLGPTVIGYLPTWAIYFTVYDWAKGQFSAVRGPDDPLSHILAAMTAGASSTIATNPLWVVKTRFMTQQASDGRPYRHTLDALQRIYRAEGGIAFYRGLLPSLFGIVHVAVQFPLYERFKRLSRPLDGSPIPSSTILLCSSASKMVASIATYPHEVLRTRLQIQKHSRAAAVSSPSSATAARGPPHAAAPAAAAAAGTTAATAAAAEPAAAATASGASRPALHARPNAPQPPAFEGLVATFRRILSQEGAKGFYRGMMTNLIRTVPSSAITILSYELLMRRMMEWTHPEGEAEAKSRG